MTDTPDNSERLRHMEEDIKEIRGEIKELRGELRGEIKELRGDIKGIQTTLVGMSGTLGEIKGALPHFATKEEVEQAKHEATKGKYGLILSVIAILSSFGVLLSRIFL